MDLGTEQRMQAEPPAMLTPDSGIGKFFANFGTPTPEDGSGSQTQQQRQQRPSADGAAAAKPAGHASFSNDPLAGDSRASCGENSRASIAVGGNRRNRKASVSALVKTSSYDESSKANKVRADPKPPASPKSHSLAFRRLSSHSHARSFADM